MKTIISITFGLIFTQNAFSQQPEYKLKINGQSFNIAIDKEYSLKIDGKETKLKLTQDDTLTFSTELYEFKYPKTVRISQNKIDEGVSQISILTAEGNGLLIQKYTTIDPTQVTNLMLQELTKESKNYGYTEAKKSFTKQLKSGQSINVTSSVLTYLDDTDTYEIAAIGKKDSGILIVTINTNEETKSEGQKIIDLMWSTLRFY